MTTTPGPSRLALLRVAALAGRALLVVWVTATVVFLALRAAGGDPVEAVLGGPGSQAGPEAVAAARAQYGLDLPVWQQYLLQLWRVLTLDLGDSYARRTPVLDLVLSALGPTAALAVSALVLGWLLALGAAWLVSWARAVSGRLAPVGRAVVAVVRGWEVLASVLPHFWLGAVLVALFAVGLRWFPATSTPGSLAGLVLPTVTLAIPLAGFLGQLLGEGVGDAESRPFATTARARGAGPTRVFSRHTLRHAAIPTVALTGWAFGFLVSGAVVVETLFGRPGLGRLLVDSTLQRDVPVVMGAIVVIALVYVLLTVVTEAVEGLLDPRAATTGEDR
ncbi:MAG: ABC transporter permease [Salana multivorans]|nr:ABC transporter permease [Salana multivorans]